MVPAVSMTVLAPTGGAADGAGEATLGTATQPALVSGVAIGTGGATDATGAAETPGAGEAPGTAAPGSPTAAEAPGALTDPCEGAWAEAPEPMSSTTRTPSAVAEAQAILGRRISGRRSGRRICRFTVPGVSRMRARAIRLT